MKRKLFPALAITTMMMAASCSQDDLVDNVASGKDVDVTFTANLEGMAETRAISDGLTVDQLIFEVYDENGNRIDALRQDDIAVANHAATVNVRLVKGQTYQFVFWAQNSAQTYYDVTDLKEIEVLNYTSDANDEKRDAFYWYEPATKVTGSFSKNITLYRPFAQLNLGTTVEDIAAAEKAGVSIAQSTVTVTGAVYSKLNTFNKEVTEPVDATFALANIPANSEDLIIRDDLNQFENDYYKYLSTNYLLAPLGGELSTKLVFDLVDDKGQQINELTVTNAPLQRNWRTNIVGDILTGEGTFNIVIDPIYDGDYNYEMDGTWLDIWDGTSKEPVEVNGVYEIASASNLVWMSEQPEGTFNGKSFTLTKDISFKNVDAPEGSDVDNNGDTTPATIKPLFKGTARNINFNGNNHVIRDFIIEAEGADDASLFGTQVGSTISYLTIINADVKGAVHADSRAAIVVGSTFGTVTLENVTVKDSKLEGVQKIGGLIGFVHENQVKVNNCVVDGLTLNSLDLANESGATGGLIGYVQGGRSEIVNCVVKNSAIKTIQAVNDASRANGEFIGVIASSSTIAITNSSVANNQYENSIAWTPYHNPFVGGNRGGNATLIVNDKTFQPVPTYTGETLFSTLNATLDDTVIDNGVVKRISNGTFETLVLDETQTAILLENVVIKDKLKLPAANTVLLKNVVFETAKPFEFINGAFAAQFQFIAYSGTVKVGTTIVNNSNMEELLGITTGSSYFETTW